MLKDEHQALQLTYTSVEEKFKKCQEEYNEILGRFLEFKKLEVAKKNSECDEFYR